MTDSDYPPASQPFFFFFFFLPFIYYSNQDWLTCLFVSFAHNACVTIQTRQEEKPSFILPLLSLPHSNRLWHQTTTSTSTSTSFVFHTKHKNISGKAAVFTPFFFSLFPSSQLSQAHQSFCLLIFSQTTIFLFATI